MRKVRRFSWSKFLLFLLFLAVLAAIALVGLYKFETSPVSSNKTPKLITVEKGDNYYTIASKLKAKNLIRSVTFYKLYLKLSSPSSLSAGDYELNESESVKEIVNILSNEKNQKKDILKVTFREGLNIRQVAKIVEEKASISAEEFIGKITNQEYLKTIQKDYWFLTDSIYNEQIYYPLEGYLFPDTYQFDKKILNSESIIKKMLDNTKLKLEPYKEKLTQNSTYNVHQILTLASLIEQEAVTSEDRALVSSVFYNRLKKGMALGSDVTTYYASKKSLTESLTKEELTDCNGYNTRCTTMKGLPVGPISNFSASSIEAALNPTPSDYYYFVADINKKVYFTKNLNEHNKTIAKLKSEGKWAA